MSSNALFKGALVSLAVSVLSTIFCFGASAETERINDFVTSAKVQQDSSVLVTEWISYDFEDSERYGFYRNIPLTLTRGGGTYTVDFTFVGATETDDNDVMHAIPSKVTRHDDGVTVYVGSPKKRLSGRHVYKLEYILRHGVNFFDGAPEFFWNVTGAEFPVPVDNVSLRLYPPRGTKPSEVKKKAYIGSPAVTEGVGMSVEDSYVKFTAGPLAPGDEFVVIGGLPAGSVQPPTPFTELVFWTSDWLAAIVLPLLTAFSVWVVWWRYGRDAANPEAIPNEWNPPTEISPAEVGTIYDEHCDAQDIIATLIDLAARGHLKIKEMEKQSSSATGVNDYLLVKTAPPSDDMPLRAYESNFLNGLFGLPAETLDQVRLSELKNKFYDKLPSIREQIYEALSQEGYFQENPETVRNHFAGLALFFCFVGLFLILASSTNFLLAPFGAGMVASAAIIGACAVVMPARTEKGVNALRQSLGFARFINSAESRRIALLAQEDPAIFGRLLPYTMVLGVADKWAEDFHGVLKQAPAWYEPANGSESQSGQFSPARFVVALGTGMRAMEAALMSEPASVGATLEIDKDQSPN